MSSEFPEFPCGTRGWLPIGEPKQLVTAWNGLQWGYQQVQREDRTIRVARSKYYDLSQLHPFSRMEFETYLKARHSEVMTRVGSHPNITLNYDAFPAEQGAPYWCVIDEWIDGCTLESMVGIGGLAWQTLKPIMRDIASGLARLHEIGIVRRNLTPHTVLVTDERSVLTDIELWRLFQNVPSISGSSTWRGHCSIASEVAAGSGVTTSVDLYSWSMVLLYASTGIAPESLEEASRLLTKAGLPHRVSSFAQDCLRAPIEKRPNSCRQLLAILGK